MRSDDELEKSMIESRLTFFESVVGRRTPPNSQGMFLGRRKKVKTAPPNLKDRSVASADWAAGQPQAPSKVDGLAESWRCMPPPIHAPRRQHMHSTCWWFGACRPERIESNIFGRISSVKTQNLIEKVPAYMRLTMEKTQYCQHRHLLPY